MPPFKSVLRWTDDKGEHNKALVTGAYMLGRSPECDVEIHKKGISRKHARLTVSDKNLNLEDLGSSAGSFFNGEHLVPGELVTLIPGDRFSLGRVVFSLEISSQEAPDLASNGFLKTISQKDWQTTLKNPSFDLGMPLDEGVYDETKELLATFRDVHESISVLLKASPNSGPILARLSGIDGQLEKQLVQYRILQKVTQVLGQIQDIRIMLKMALKMVGEELGADRGFIILYDSAIHKMNSMVTWHFDLTSESSKYDYNFSHTLATESVQTGRILIINNAMKDPQFQSSQSIFASKIQSVICIPLFRGNDILGVIYLDNLNKEGQFQSVHEGFLRTFARQASMALHNAKLYTQAVTDDLSGLFLRNYMERRIREELARVQRHQGVCSLLMADIDFFKNVNDTYGHPAGDQVISEVARRLLRSAREMDVVGRFGGEEFIMLLPETGTEGAEILAERIRKAVSQATFRSGGRTFSVTTSIGLACSVDCEEQSVEALIKAADKALYIAKGSGRNCSIVYKRKKLES